MKGKFITFEGSEGSGKSTQAKLLAGYFKSKGKHVLHIREPGGIKISEGIRKILLSVKNNEMTKTCEMLLYMAARAQLVDQIIVPALKKGTIVLCDRFLDSTVAYQGYGCGMDMQFIKSVGCKVTQNLSPDLTFVFDIETREGLSRTGKKPDRIESRSIKYHRRVRSGYLDIARKEPKRVKVISVDANKAQIQTRIRAIIKKTLKI